MKSGWLDFDSIYSAALDAERRVVECEKREVEGLRLDRNWWRDYARALHRQLRDSGLIPVRSPNA